MVASVSYDSINLFPRSIFITIILLILSLLVLTEAAVILFLDRHFNTTLFAFSLSRSRVSILILPTLGSFLQIIIN